MLSRGRYWDACERWSRRFVLGAFLAVAGTVRADDVLVHSFTGGTSDGEFPVGDVTVSGGTIFGITNAGGTSNTGTIYQLNASGGGLKILHSFSSGRDPSGSLTLGGSTLYGMTNTTNGFGEIFQVATSGAGYVSIHNFVGGTTDGRAPLGSLLLVGSTLYGMTQRGGAHDFGTVFGIQTNGTGFTLLHSFASTDGSFPEGALTAVGGVLFGMTTTGIGGGVVFRMDTDGGNFLVLHTFGAGSDGASPKGTLLADGTTLYGTTSSGGQFGNGTVFKIDTAGTGYAVLHDFAGGMTDGALPTGSLTQANGTLYGTTQSGGASDAGTVFQFDVSDPATTYALAHSFAGATTDGQSPQGSLAASPAGFLFGTTGGGGASGFGTVFVLGNALPSPTPTPTPTATPAPTPATSLAALLRKLHSLKKSLSIAKKIADPAVRAAKVAKLKKKIAALKKQIAAAS